MGSSVFSKGPKSHQRWGGKSIREKTPFLEKSIISASLFDEQEPLRQILQTGIFQLIFRWVEKSVSEKITQ